MKKFITLILLGVSIFKPAYSQIPSYVPSTGLVGWWPFNGNANDESGNGNNGLVSGAILTPDRFGTSNKAYYFDGISNYITVPPASGLYNASCYTVSAWIKNDAWSNTTEYQWLIFGKAGSVPQFVLRPASNEQDARMQFCDGISCPGTITTSNVMDYNWHHVVGYVGQDSIWIFFDGQKQGAIANVIYNPQLCNSADYQIGGFRNAVYCGGNSFLSQIFHGTIDDIAVYNRKLTPFEILQLYNSNNCITYQTITVTDTLIINANLTGISPVTFANTIKVYPNPSKDHISIDFGSNYATMNGYTLRIDNSLSQTVYSTIVSQQSNYIDLNTWSGIGVYFVYLYDSQGHLIDVRKIVLQ